MEDIKKSFSHFTKNIRSRIMCAMTNAFTLAEGATHVAMLKNVRRCAFTLAEVLITLGIIGVVAALTLPTLIQNHQKQVYVTGLKKAYSTIQNAFNKMAFDEGVTDWKDTYYASNLDRYDNEYRNECMDYIVKQFNVINTKKVGDDCNSDWCSVYNPLFDGITYSYFPMFITADNMVYLLDCRSTIIYVDINGTKGPAKRGRDVFIFDVDYSNNKVVPRGTRNDAWQKCTTEVVNDTNYYFWANNCAARVIIEGKMNY